MAAEALTADPVAAVIERQVVAYNAHDLDAFVACFAPDATLVDLSQGRTIAAGREAIAATYARTFERRPKAGVAIEQRIVVGDTVIDHERILADGRQAVAIYSVRDGLIANLWLISAP